MGVKSWVTGCVLVAMVAQVPGQKVELLADINQRVDPRSGGPNGGFYWNTRFVSLDGVIYFTTWGQHNTELFAFGPEDAAPRRLTFFSGEISTDHLNPYNPGGPTERETPQAQTIQAAFDARGPVPHTRTSLAVCALVRGKLFDYAAITHLLTIYPENPEVEGLCRDYLADPKRSETRARLALRFPALR